MALLDVKHVKKKKVNLRAFFDLEVQVYKMTKLTWGLNFLV